MRRPEPNTSGYRHYLPVLFRRYFQQPPLLVFLQVPSYAVLIRHKKEYLGLFPDDDCSVDCIGLIGVRCWLNRFRLPPMATKMPSKVIANAIEPKIFTKNIFLTMQRCHFTLL